MLSQGYKRSDADHYLYTNQATNGSFFILVLYVDDMLIDKNSIEEISTLKSKLHSNFDMKDMGEASHILGMQVKEKPLWLKIGTTGLVP